MNDIRTLRVALLGAGSVGAQVARLLIEQQDDLAERSGTRLELVGILVRDVDAPRDVDLPRNLLTADPEPLIQGADVVIELLGGLEPARAYITLALQSGADVVTANKALIATHGVEIFDLADQVGASVSYEAAVAAAIPIVRPLKDSLAGDRVSRIFGIVNGSTNFILDKMDREGLTADDAQALATELGYLEADPTLDLDGHDAQQKAAILASLAFHTPIPVDEVHREGIRDVTAEQIAAAKRADAVIKLLAICERISGRSGDEVSVRVYPALVSRDHPLATVHGGNNAVFVEADAAGPLMFYGAGAGGVQTASAVLGDLVSAARRHVAGGGGVGESPRIRLPLAPIGRTITRYQIALEVADTPGVLANVARTFGDGGVSIATLEQTIEDDGTAHLLIGTHRASDEALSAAVSRLAGSPAVRRVASVLRVEGE